MTCLREPLFGGENDLPRVRVEPAPPPTEGAVRDDVMAAKAHQPQVIVGPFRAVVVDDDPREAGLQLLPRPLRLVGEDEEPQIGERPGELADASQVVIHTAGPVSLAGCPAGHVVAATDMEGNRVATANFPGQLQVFSGERRPAGELAADDVTDVGEVPFRLPVPLQVDVVRGRQDLRVEVEMTLPESGGGSAVQPEDPSEPEPEEFHPAADRHCDPGYLLGRRCGGGDIQLSELEGARGATVLAPFEVGAVKLQFRVAAVRQAACGCILEHLVAETAHQLDNDHGSTPYRFVALTKQPKCSSSEDPWSVLVQRASMAKAARMTRRSQRPGEVPEYFAATSGNLLISCARYSKKLPFSTSSSTTNP